MSSRRLCPRCGRKFFNPTSDPLTACANCAQELAQGAAMPTTVAGAERETVLCAICYLPEWCHATGDLRDDIPPKSDHSFIPKKEAER